MSWCEGDLQVVNRLLRAAREAENLHSHKYKDIIASIQDDHLQAVKSHIKSPKIVGIISEAISRECGELIIFLEAVQRIGEISPKSVDRIISKGEVLSAIFVAALLQDRGVDSQYVDLSDIVGLNTSPNLDQDFYDRLAAALGGRIEACGEKVPVVTGYFGIVPGVFLVK